jgi:hypothetical protein
VSDAEVLKSEAVNVRRICDHEVVAVPDDHPRHALCAGRLSDNLDADASRNRDGSTGSVNTPARG